jgi:hypothetical protein
MTPQQTKNNIAELEFWLEHNPNHSDRTTIETDLRKLKEQQQPQTTEQSTFDFQELKYLQSMNNIINRFDDLSNVLRYCSDQQSFGYSACFSTVERICINQERGSLLSQLNQENKAPAIRYYKCPPELEIKIRVITQKKTDKDLKNK